MDNFSTLVENAIEGIFRTSPDGKYLYANPSLARLYGYESPDELKNSVTDIVKQLYVDPSRRDQFIEKIKARGEVRDFISEIWRKDKSKIWILENAREIRDENGSLLYYEGFVSDVTEKMTMIERLRRSERMEAIGQLSSGIAHDFNNMLSAMRGYAEMITIHPGLEPKVAEYAGTIVKASERANELTKKLLAFSKKDERKMRASDINRIVGEVAALLERSVGRDIKIRLNVSAMRSSSVCDAGQLGNAILNLAANARDAMPKGGSLAISTANERLDTPFKWCKPPSFHAGDYLKISVSDTGVGMNLDASSGIFEPFYTTKENGTGMGLAGVYATVINHGGTINVKSSLGAGSTFSLYIPLDIKTAEKDFVPKANLRNGLALTKGKGRILIADDNELALAFLSDLIKGLGYEILKCEDGLRALNLYKERRYDIDLCILDIDMPEMDGVALFKAMRLINPEVKAIFITGLGDSVKCEEAAAMESVALFRKPFDPIELSKRISEELLERNMAAC